ncbi:MAG: sigma-70 family RNA polymerase sigma factor [Candidatus Eisenbacteria bacterium]|nr:sigma-70 family RNA polymerase sigma factor [Candidatus Eisenbacteria bacterium]
MTPNRVSAVATPDRALLERVRLRDPEALGAFYDRYLDLVFGLAWRLLGDRTRAEDAASEVFLKVHRAADRLDPERDPAPWLTTITTNVCRDVWRSGAYRMSRRAADIDDPVQAASLSTGRNDPEDDSLARERERLVQQALAELPEPLRTAIVLHDYQGLDHRQVAEVMHIAHDAARKRYSRALALLAEALKGRL